MNTVAQISTPQGVGGISIIKVSGEDSISKVNQIFKGKDLLSVDSHTLNYGYIIDGNLKIDEVLVGVMKAPKTYTGEDIVEINCHGGLLITQKILKLIIKQGVSLAGPGEFTKRAFLNGKKNIEEVQNVMDLINSKSEEALNVSINILNNSTKNLIEQLREDLLKVVTNIEVNIDYPEYEDIYQVQVQDLQREINSFTNKVEEIVRDSKAGEIVKNGINTVILGKPNAGKSSILNYLSKNQKAIVTDIEGTTRDLIETEITLDKLRLNLIDTAGIRKTEDIVEQIGVQKSIEQIEKSELILFILDNTKEINEEEIELINTINKTNKKTIFILNKMDANSQIDLDKANINISEVIKMSTIENYGEKELSQTIQKKFNVEYFDALNTRSLINIEKAIKLEEALDIMNKVKETLKEEVFLDLILLDLKEVLFVLSEILGLNPKEEYLNEIFSRFCLGK